MDKDMISYLIKLLIFLPFTVFLIYILGRLNQKGIIGINKSKHMIVLDKLLLGKDNSILITKIGNKYYLMSSCSGRVEILKELNKDELEINTYENSISENMSYFKLQKLFKKED